MSIESESAPDMTRSEEFNLIQVRVRLYSPSSIQRQIKVGRYKKYIYFSHFYCKRKLKIHLIFKKFCYSKNTYILILFK